MIERICEILTPKQREVLRLMARHLSSREIAQELGMATETARNHIIKIYDRLVDGRNTDVLSAVLASFGNTRVGLENAELCRWCTNPEENIFVYHIGECPAKKGYELCSTQELD